MSKPPPHPFWFLRHGETDWNVEGRLQGHTDTPLNDVGLAQAAVAGQLLAGAGIERIISSPLARARRTAEIVAEALNLPVAFDPALMERTFGSWEGQLTNDVKRAHGLMPHESITAILPHDAEQWEQTKARIAGAIARGLQAHPGRTVLFVSHGAVFRALHEVLCGNWREAGNARPYRFTPHGAGWRFESPFMPDDDGAIDRLRPTG